MEYPKYKRLKNSKFYVKLIDSNNNLHLRKTMLGWSMDYNGSLNDYYESDYFVGCSKQEFDTEYIKIVEILNKDTKL